MCFTSTALLHACISKTYGAAGGHFVHPVRKLFDAPPIYEFATPLKGTSPVWYDPSY